MARKVDEEPVRGLWERVPGSGVWWIRYRVNGVLKREKVGRKSDAIDLLNTRRNERRVGVKLPDNLRDAGLKFKVLSDDIERYSEAHHRDRRNILSGLAKIRPDFDERMPTPSSRKTSTLGSRRTRRRRRRRTDTAPSSASYSVRACEIRK